MLIFLWILEIIIGVLLVIAVLLQVGKGETFSLFGGGFQSILGPKAPATILEKITYGLIGAFFVVTLLIAKFSVSEKIAPVQELPVAPSPEEILPEGPKNLTK
jgi:protein translocase SecG subunit